MMEEDRALIIDNKDPKYIKEYIKNNFDKLDFRELMELIMTVNEPEYIKECVKSRKMALPVSMKLTLIQLLEDDSYIKECIIDKSLNLTSQDKEILLIGMKDKSYIKKEINNKNIGLTSNSKTNLIIYFEDKIYTKECIVNKELKLDLYDVTRLIKSLKDPSYTKKCIMDKSFNFSSDDIIRLIKSIGDLNYIRECINNKKLTISTDGRVELILSLGDSNETKQYLVDESLGLDSSQKVKLIVSIHDKEYVKECIMGNEVMLKPSDKLILIQHIGDKDFLDECLSSPRIDDESKILLAMIKKDVEAVYSFLPMNIESRSFNLPIDMTIGMEIESEGDYSIPIINWFNYGEWEAKPDGSIPLGVEVVSPILHPTNEEARQVYRVNEILTKIGQNITEACGAHIHIGADYLTSKQAYINLMEIWCNVEKSLYAVCNEENSGPRKGIIRHAKPISSRIQSALDKGSINLDEDMELDKFVEELKDIQKFKDRCVGLNLLNVNNKKNTIEFRLANGTLDPDLWMDNINLFGGIVAISEELSRIQARGIESEEDAEKIEMFEKLKSDITEAEKLDILLKLVGVEPEEYKKRYESNIEFINNNLEMKALFLSTPLNMEFPKSEIEVKDIGEVTETVTVLEEHRALESLISSKRQKSKIMQK